jgi:hypothetical protein
MIIRKQIVLFILVNESIGFYGPQAHPTNLGVRRAGILHPVQFYKRYGRVRRSELCQRNCHFGINPLKRVDKSAHARTDFTILIFDVKTDCTQHQFQRTAAAPLARRNDLSKICHNEWEVSHIPPLLLSQFVERLEQ